MKSVGVSLLCVLVACLVGLVAYRTGHHSGIETGEEIGRGREAWNQIALNRVYLALYAQERFDELADQFEENMWIPLREVHSFAHDDRAPVAEREAADWVLRQPVLHFYLETKIPPSTQDLDLAKSVSQGLVARSDQLGEDSQTTQAETEFAGAMNQLEDVLEAQLTANAERDREIHEFLDRLIAERHFPGKKRQSGRMSVWITGGSVGSSFSQNGEFDVESRKEPFLFEAKAKDLVLTVNGKEVATLSPDSEIDFRVPGKIFVDGEEFSIPSKAEISESKESG